MKKKPFILDEYTYRLDFGIHEKKLLKNVPPDYLLYCYEKKLFEGFKKKALKDWVEFYIDDLRYEVQKQSLKKLNSDR